MENLLRLTNKDPKFYKLLGPFLSRREVVKDLGYPVWDDDGKHWIVALRGKVVVGFCGWRQEKDHVVFASSYVLPKYRKGGVYRQLVAARLADIPKPCRVRVTANANSFPLLKKQGFRPVRQFKNFTTMEMEVTE